MEAGMEVQEAPELGVMGAVVEDDAKREAAETVYRQLAVELTDEELAERAHEYAEKDRELDAVEEERKRIAKDFKDRLVCIRAEKDALRTVVHTGKEDRSIECEVFKDFTHAKVEVVRIDTGEIVETRVMSAYERQLAMEVDADAEDDLGEDEGLEQDDEET